MPISGTIMQITKNLNKMTPKRYKIKLNEECGNLIYTVTSANQENATKRFEQIKPQYKGMIKSIKEVKELENVEFDENGMPLYRNNEGHIININGKLINTENGK